MSDFVHLHLHTQFSLLDGAIRFDRLFDVAKSYGIPACAITDHGNMFGAVEFYFTALEYGIKPIIGCEAYIAPRSRFEKERGGDNAYHLILLAMNDEGYRNLIRLVSHAHLEGFYYVPRIDMELLEAHHAGLVCLTSCLKGQIPRLILRGDEKNLAATVERYLSLFGDRLFLELQDNGIPEQKKVNEGLVDLSRRYGIPLVATNDCHYLKKEESRAHELLLCIQTGKTINDKDRLKLSTDQFYFKSPEEMERAFSPYPEALKNTIRIAEMCDLRLQSGVYHFPHFSLPDNEGLEEHLERLCRKGFDEKIVKQAELSHGERPEDLLPRYRERLDYELDVIRKTGFAGYFLIVSDFIDYARSQDIPVGPGRGSAAGSLAAYCLGITTIDPIKYDLLFERFLNPERISMPDIDVDLCIDGRERVIAYVTEKYGKENVAQIITFGTMKSKAAVRDVGRALALPYGEVDRIAKLIPATLDISIEQAMVEEPRLRDLYDNDPRVAELLDNARVLERLARHASTHAAGIVISNKPLMDHLPLYRGQKGETITQYSMKCIEKIGLVKFDLLGLKTLTIIDTVVKTLRRSGIMLDSNNLPLDDGKTFELLCAGDTSGVFQLESRGMRELLTRLRPSQFEDIIALIALYRPGPLTSGMMEQFIQRKNDPSRITYETELLREVLRDTYGVIVYQEQIMKIASRLAGFSQGEADALRKAISKKVPEQLENYRSRFIAGSTANGVPGDVAERIYDVILRFGQYGFNKSHSAAYALVAYQTAYLKAHHYIPFMAAILTNEVNDTDNLIKYITECRDHGVEILPPDINESTRAFTVLSGKIRFGLSGIKNVGDAALDSILEIREQNGPFGSFAHFCSSVDSRKVNKKVLESLVKAGCFDGMGVKRSHLLGLAGEHLERLQKKGKNGRQMDMFGSGDLSGADEPEPSWSGEELSREEIVRGEKEAFGFYFSQHPLSVFEHGIKRITDLDTATLKEADTDGDISLVGIVNAFKEITTKRGDRMAVVMLEDVKGMVETVLFPDLLSRTAAIIKSEKPVVVTGLVERNEDNTVKIRAKNVTLLEDAIRNLESVVWIRLDCAAFRKEDLKKLRDVLTSIRGDARVRLEFIMDGQRRKMDVDLRIDAHRLDVLLKQFASGIAVEVIE